MSNAAFFVRDLPHHAAADQEVLLRARAAACRHIIKGIYRDGTQGRRSGRRAMLRDAGSRFDLLLVTSGAVLGRTLVEVVAALNILVDRDVRLVIADGTVGSAEALLMAAPAMGTIRAAQVREAVVEGQHRARAAGVRFGRPAVSEERKARALGALADGLGLRAAARRAGLGVATVVRLRDGA